MALQKTKQYKGIDCSYWRINELDYNDITDVAIATLGLYYSAESAEADLHNWVDKQSIKVTGVSQIETPEEAQGLSPRDLLKTLLYVKIKESNVQLQPSRDEDGNILYNEDRSQQTEEVETNWFADAVDC